VSPRSLFLVFLLAAAPLARGQSPTADEIAINLRNSFYASNRPYIDPVVRVWPVSSPAAQNLDAGVLAAAVPGPKGASFLVARSGKLVHERYFGGATAATALNNHSASKSVLSTLVGIGIDEGLLSLDTPISTLLPQPMSAGHAAITVEDLLTMTSGLAWEEDVTEYELGPNFVADILALPLAAAPGTRFNYSTGDAQLLGAVLAESAGESLYDFARTRLLEPLEIDVEAWGRYNDGYFTGGHSFFITPREMAAFGQLMLDEGKSGGRQIVSREWVEHATSSDRPPSYFGHQWWLDVHLDGHDGYRAWGFAGQMIYVFPEDEMVVVLTHDTAGGGEDIDLNDWIEANVIAAILGPPVEQELGGDFNSDGEVDLADYTVWRNHLGAASETVLNGAGDGLNGVDVGDYRLWKGNFGQAQGAASVDAVEVPEPASVLFLLLVVVNSNSRRRSGLYESTGRRA
jgi:CubicO group peptidase (beta-lactamase class C family)